MLDSGRGAMIVGLGSYESSCSALLVTSCVTFE
jgi:hypothetical protein